MDAPYAHLFSRLHYLFVAHGAGLVGCLAVLREYASTPHYRGIGTPIVLFGLGLISATFSYITLSISQTLAKNAVLNRAEHEPSMAVFWVHYGGLFASVVSLLGALVVIAWRAFFL